MRRITRCESLRARDSKNPQYISLSFPRCGYSTCFGFICFLKSDTSIIPKATSMTPKKPNDRNILKPTRNDHIDKGQALLFRLNDIIDIDFCVYLPKWTNFAKFIVEFKIWKVHWLSDYNEPQRDLFTYCSWHCTLFNCNYPTSLLQIQSQIIQMWCQNMATLTAVLFMGLTTVRHTHATCPIPYMMLPQLGFSFT